MFLSGGHFSGNLDSNLSIGTIDAFVTKFNNDGVKQWTKSFGSSLRVVVATSVNVDSFGNIFLTGYTEGGLNGNTMTGYVDAFVIKLNSEGSRQWTKQLGSSTRSTYGFGGSVDGSGNVFIGGYTNGTLPANLKRGITDAFIVKYNTDGDRLWTKQLGSSAKDTYGFSISADKVGNVFIGGFTNGALSGNTLTGAVDAFVAKYDTNGFNLWIKQLGASGKTTYGYGIATNRLNDIFITGQTSGSPDGITAPLDSTAFVAKYDNNGNKK